MAADTITSHSNPIFKKLLSLHTSKGINQSRIFLAGGEKLIREIIAENKERIALWIRTPRLSYPPPAVSDINAVTLSSGLFDELNIIGTSGPLLALRLADMPAFSFNAPWPAGCTIFIPFGDPENVGAVIRSAVGLGASRVVLLQEAASPFLPRAMRSSSGAVLRIKMEKGPSLGDFTRPQGKTPVFALDLQGRNVGEIHWPPVFGIIAGLEGKGLPPEVKSKCMPISIPLQYGLDSLNAAVAVSIALWTWRIRSSQ